MPRDIATKPLREFACQIKGKQILVDWCSLSTIFSKGIHVFLFEMCNFQRNLVFLTIVNTVEPGTRQAHKKSGILYDSLVLP